MDNAAAPNWKKQTWSLSWLKKQANDYKHLPSAMSFLRAVGVVPMEEDFDGRNWLPSLSLPAHAIPGKYLAEFANDWDELGESSPVDFIDAIEFEVKGTEKRDVVVQTLASLGVHEAAPQAA